MRGNVPPAVPGGDDKCHGPHLTWWGIIGRCAGYQCRVEERSVIIGSAHISPCSAVLPAKSENRNGKCERRFEVKLILKKSSLSG